MVASWKHGAVWPGSQVGEWVNAKSRVVGSHPNCPRRGKVGKKVSSNDIAEKGHRGSMFGHLSIKLKDETCCFSSCPLPPKQLGFQAYTTRLGSDISSY